MTSAVESGSMIASSRARRRTDVAFDRRAGPAPLLPMGKDAAFISSESRLTARDIRPDHLQVVAGGLERLLGLMVRNKPSVVVKCQIALPAETIKDN